MVDFSNKHLVKMEEFLTEYVSGSSLLSNADIDPREIIFTLGEELRIKQFRWNNNMICVPNVVRILLLESKADKTEEIEMMFSAPTFTGSMVAYLEESNLHLLMPVRVEVELVSKGSSRMGYAAGRCVLTLDWPLAEEADMLDVVIDDIKKQVLQVQQRKPEIPLLARLTALNADVYHNNYFITKELTYLGRLRVVRDTESGRFLRRNDFVFAQLEDAKAINNSVSRQQAKIEFRDNAFYLVDQGAANPTAIERGKTGMLTTVPVKGGSGAKLEDGDVIVLGSARVRFNIVENIDTTSLAHQREQDQLAKLRERSAPSPTMKLPALTPQMMEDLLDNPEE